MCCLHTDQILSQFPARTHARTHAHTHTHKLLHLSKLPASNKTLSRPAIYSHQMMMCRRLGFNSLNSKPENCLQREYDHFCIYGASVSRPVVIFSNCCNAFTHDHPQTGFKFYMPHNNEEKYCRKQHHVLCYNQIYKSYYDSREENLLVALINVLTMNNSCCLKTK